MQPGDPKGEEVGADSGQWARNDTGRITNPNFPPPQTLAPSLAKASDLSEIVKVGLSIAYGNTQLVTSQNILPTTLTPNHPHHDSTRSPRSPPQLLRDTESLSDTDAVLENISKIRVQGSNDEGGSFCTPS